MKCSARAAATSPSASRSSRPWVRWATAVNRRHRGPFPLEHLDALQDTRPQARIARG
jgi:hypothetical protein